MEVSVHLLEVKYKRYFNTVCYVIFWCAVKSRREPVQSRWETVRRIFWNVPDIGNDREQSSSKHRGMGADSPSVGSRVGCDALTNPAAAGGAVGSSPHPTAWGEFVGWGVNRRHQSCQRLPRGTSGDSVPNSQNAEKRIPLPARQVGLGVAKPHSPLVISTVSAKLPVGDFDHRIAACQ